MVAMAGLASIPMKKCTRGCSICSPSFAELRSAKAVMRHFQEANFLVPVRTLDGLIQEVLDLLPFRQL